MKNMVCRVELQTQLSHKYMELLMFYEHISMGVDQQSID